MRLFLSPSGASYPAYGLSSIPQAREPASTIITCAPAGEVLNAQAVVRAALELQAQRLRARRHAGGWQLGIEIWYLKEGLPSSPLISYFEVLLSLLHGADVGFEPGKRPVSKTPCGYTKNVGNLLGLIVRLWADADAAAFGLSSDLSARLHVRAGRHRVVRRLACLVYPVRHRPSGR